MKAPTFCPLANQFFSTIFDLRTSGTGKPSICFGLFRFRELADMGSAVHKPKSHYPAKRPISSMQIRSSWLGSSPAQGPRYAQLKHARLQAGRARAGKHAPTANDSSGPETTSLSGACTRGKIVFLRNFVLCGAVAEDHRTPRRWELACVVWMRVGWPLVPVLLSPPTKREKNCACTPT